MEIQRVARYHVSRLQRLSDSNTFMEIPSHLQALVTQLDALSPDDLQLLNLHIVEKFKEIHASRRASIMASFMPGDLVSFEDKQGQQLSATVIRTNKKTVSLMTLDEVRWNVAPELLTLQSSHSDKSINAEVIHTDNFASMDNPGNWWPKVVQPVFSPIESGAVAPNYDWSRWWTNHTPDPFIDPRIQ